MRGEVYSRNCNYVPNAILTLYIITSLPSLGSNHKQKVKFGSDRIEVPSHVNHDVTQTTVTHAGLMSQTLMEK